MSVQAMSWALKQKVVTDAAARHVLLCLCNYAGDTGRGAFPSSQTLADDTGLSKRSVQRKLDDLEAAGVIARGNQAAAAVYIARVDRRPIVYDVLMGSIERGDTVSPRAERGDNHDTNGVTTVHERGDTVSPNPSLNPSVEPKSTPRCALADLFPGVDAQVLADFKILRTKLRAPITPTAAAGIRREAEKAGVTVQHALAMCCERGWRGFKADWAANTTGATHAAREPRVGLADRHPQQPDRAGAIEGTAIRVDA